LRAAGWSREEIDWRTRTGRLHRLHPGVYAVGHCVVPKEGWLMAAILASGPDAVLSLRSAAALWGLRGYSAGAVHVAVPRKSTSTKQIKKHFSAIPPDERAMKEGIPVTSAARTLFDLAAAEDVESLQTMLREMEYLQLWGRLSLWDLLER
jgi:predicted transcriptional regulator of viral defense system